jgi:hypothetical protein
VGAPELQVARSGDRIILSWPASAGCAALHSSPRLSPASWSTVSESVVSIGDQYAVSLVPSGSARFFSLRCETTSLPVEVATQVATRHARDIWVERRIAPGEPILAADIRGEPFAYLLPFRLNAESYPSPEVILDIVASLKAQFGLLATDGPEHLSEEYYAALQEALGSMSYILVSATRANYPVLLVQNCLPPYYLFQDSARRRAIRHLDSRTVDLIGFFMTAPQHEYFGFSAGRSRVFIHARTLEAITPEQFASLPTYGVPPELALDRDRAWLEVLRGERLGNALPRNDPAQSTIQPDAVGPLSTPATGSLQLKWIDDYTMIPIVDWTYWCVPTAFTMATCFYDHYFKANKILGYGRIVDFWYENGTGHNVPNFIDELIDPTRSPPSWRTGGLMGVLNSPGWNGYGFSLKNTDGHAANDWAWAGLVSELNANRPVVWGNEPTNNTTGHAMTAFGYRVVGAQRFVIVYNTWGTTPQQQYAEYNYNQWIKGGASGGTGFAQILPGGATGSDDGFLLSPRGGEVVFGPSQIQWQVTGEAIKSTELYDSIDAGKTWVYRGSFWILGPGIYDQAWTPPAVTPKGRVRIRCLDASGNLVAGDGSVRNVYFQALPDLEPVAGTSGYCQIKAGQLAVVVANRGPVDAPASSTQVKFMNSTGPQSVQLPTPSIPANSSVEILFDIPSACWDFDCNFEIEVDVFKQVNEANEGNNVVTGACAG